MKKKSLIKYIVSMLILLVTATAWFGTEKTAGAVQRLEDIDAYYVGEAVEVGKPINIRDIYVNARYFIHDGYSSYDDYLEVNKGFTINPSVVNHKGKNQIVVTYQGKSCVLEIEGKVVESITAEYIGDEVYVGTPVPAGKIEVYAAFSDGSYEQVRNFTLSDAKVAKIGLNVIPVTYCGKTGNIYVYGKAPLAVEEIDADYIGESVIVGNPINKSDIMVNLSYNDGTFKTDVKNFNISPTYVKYEGENEITVSYGEISTTVYVYGEERYITDMKANYIGGGVIVGECAEKEEFEVIVTYNDGSEEQTDEFELFGAEIWFEGENTVLVYCDSFMQDVMVPGVKGFAANYDNAISGYFESPDSEYFTEVTLGMNIGLDPAKFELRVADNSLVEYAVQRVIPTEEFIGFEVFYDDDEMVLEFPMAIKVSVPSGFEPEKFGVYYTPNKSTIMAKVDGEFVDDSQTEYQFIVYEPGMYVLVREVSNLLVTEIIVETELEMKVNRSFSLNPVVFPLNADNRSVTYRSTDEDVATVSDNGKIRTYSEGECEIWIEAEDDSGVYVVVNVVVKNGR